MKQKLHLLLVLTLLGLCTVLSVQQSYAQAWPADTVNTSINSGNPKFPFPQFLEYHAGKTLAKHNGEGVTHADMEKAMKEGYKIMMHRSLYVPGKALNGVRYIVYNHANVPYNNNTFVSEGDGYALLAAAYFADKPTFDGLWLWIHDNRLSKVKKYYDCTDLRPTYRYGANLPGWKNVESTPDNDGDNDSATDGDYDIAMGLLLAYAQWGDAMGINDACGNPISYKDEALKMIKALVDTFPLYNVNGGYTGHMSGDIGVDGYCKNGNTWEETTAWRYSAANTAYPWAKPHPEAYNIRGLFTDYIGPAYFNQFAKFLENNGGTPWQINQFKRGEASSDWLIGQMHSKGYIASSGSCTVNDDGSVTTFGQHPSGPGGEDFRTSWRTILNYVWHGNPTETWDPVSHELIPVGNTFEKDMADRHALFMKGPGVPVGSPACQRLGASPDLSCPDWKGVVNIKQAHLVTGAEGSDNYRTNYNVGTGAAAAVASEDLDLIAEIYRQSEILWDDVNTAMPKDASDEERYDKSTPKYFHDWFRLLGMITASGNLHAPTDMLAQANLKVYMAVDKTYAYEGDELTYTVSYRNFGSVDATGTTITTMIPAEYEVVAGSISNGGSLSGNTIVWNIGTVLGFKTATGIPPTEGELTFKVKVKEVIEERVCLVSEISAPGALGWVSNEYPNNATYTMERNCVDLLKVRALAIDKEVDKRVANPGDVLNFTLDFENLASDNNYLNGGRSRVVVSYGNHYPNGNTFYQFYRFWHTGHEAYINLSNYRVSYFMNDVASIGLYNAATNPTGWNFSVDNENDLRKYKYTSATNPITFTYEAIPFGQDASGKWNQRLMIRFPNTLTSPTTHIYDKLDNVYLIHKGVLGPGFIRTKLESMPPSVLSSRLADDWSYSKSLDINKIDGQDQRLTPISNGWADHNNLDLPINNYSRDVCNPDVPNFKRLLVEEFDGYTWRRIAGSGPLPGRDAYNVVVHDTLPAYLDWIGFTDAEALGIIATYDPATRIIEWKIPLMMVGAKGSLAYQATPNGTCPEMDDREFVNAAWIWSDTDSKISDTVNLKSTCKFVPPYLPPTTIKKTADKTSYKIDEDIVYTIEYEQTHGAIKNDNFSTNTDWVAPVGSPALPNPIAGGMNTGNYFYNRHAHGVDGLMKITVDMGTNAWAPYTLLLRYDGVGQPGTAAFSGIAITIWAGQMGIGGGTRFSVKNDNTILYTTPSPLSYPPPQSNPEFMIALNGDRMRIWVNAADTASAPPILDLTGVKVQAGYAGYYNNPADPTIGGGNNGQYKLTKWYSHFDSAFDLQITDPIPADLTFVSATNLGANVGGVVTWPVISGPVPRGSVYTYSWTASHECPESPILNIAYANMVGIPHNSIAAQVVVNCMEGVPVSFIEVSAKRASANTATIQWTTAWEISNDYYSIERSIDGVTFVELARVKGKGTTTRQTTYQYTDEDILPVTYYYRIAQTDDDGTVSYSAVVKLVSNATPVISLMPNPYSKETFLVLEAAEDAPIQIIVSDITGKIVFQSGQYRTNEKVALGQDFSSGVYVLRVGYDNAWYTEKIMRE
jgi:uncharacterized repeat protein (TIGR01451 family)